MKKVFSRQHSIATLLSVGLLASHLSIAQERPDHQQLADQWIMAYNDHNPSALSNLYTEDAHLMMHGGPTIKGQEAIGEFWAQDFTEDNPITTLRVTHSLEGADMVLVHGDYQVINRNTGILLGQGRFAHMWNQDDGGEWRLDRDLWNEAFEAYPGG